MATSTAAIQELLRGADQLGTKELGAFSVKVNELLAKRQRPGLPKQEARLLLRINEGLPLHLLERAATLHQKRRAETLTSIEDKELLALTIEIEQRHLERMKLLLKLAQLRGASLQSVMAELGIFPFATHG